MKQLKQLFFRLITRMFWHSRQPIQPVFHNNINRFMYFPQQRLLQCFLFRIRSHICWLNNTTNTTRRTQSTRPPTECRIFSTFDPYRTFHPSLHESVAVLVCWSSAAAELIPIVKFSNRPIQNLFNFSSEFLWITVNWERNVARFSRHFLHIFRHTAAILYQCLYLLVCKVVRHFPHSPANAS